MKNTVTGLIYETVFNLLEKHPEGVRWTDLNKEVISSDSSFHPKTVNGCIWKIVEKYPDKVYKPKKGVFRLKKFQ